MIHDWAGPTGELWCPNCRARSDVPRDVMDGNRRRELLAVAAQVLPAILTSDHRYIGYMVSDRVRTATAEGFMVVAAQLAAEFAQHLVAQVGALSSLLPQYPEPKDSGIPEGGDAR